MYGKNRLGNRNGQTKAEWVLVGAATILGPENGGVSFFETSVMIYQLT
jgi:hypothetical protein